MGYLRKKLNDKIRLFYIFFNKTDEITDNPQQVYFVSVSFPFCMLEDLKDEIIRSTMDTA